MADAKDFLEFLEGGVGMFLDMPLEFLRIEFAPMTPTGFGSQRPGLHGVQVAVNGAPTQFKAPGGLGFGAARLDEFDHPFPQVQGISFHARKPAILCPNVNMKCYSLPLSLPGSVWPRDLQFSCHKISMHKSHTLLIGGILRAWMCRETEHECLM
jgi:hypothetical protein